MNSDLAVGKQQDCAFSCLGNRIRFSSFEAREERQDACQHERRQGTKSARPANAAQ